MLKPIFTEKTNILAKKGIYTFEVFGQYTKHEIKLAVEKMYGVKVSGVKTISMRSLVKRTMRGRKVKIPSRKKTMVTLAKGQKLDIFEQKKK